MSTSTTPKKEIFSSNTGLKEQKGFRKDSKYGWFIFLFIVFLVTYGFFAFVVFK
jgi:hypothetical protein